jgi:hypothetical protein
MCFRIITTVTSHQIDANFQMDPVPDHSLTIDKRMFSRYFYTGTWLQLSALALLLSASVNLAQFGLRVEVNILGCRNIPYCPRTTPAFTRDNDLIP